MVQVYQAISAWQTFSPLRPWLAHSTPEPEPLRAALSLVPRSGLRSADQNPGNASSYQGAREKKAYRP